MDGGGGIMDSRTSLIGSSWAAESEGSQRAQTGPVIEEYVKTTGLWTPGPSSLRADQAGTSRPAIFITPWIPQRPSSASGIK